MNTTPQEKMDTMISRLTDETGESLETVVARAIRTLINHGVPAAKLLQFCLDTAADQYIGNEYYQQFPEILTFLKTAGTSEPETLFRAYMLEHPDILYCRSRNCDGTLIGGCPKLYCDTCGKEHYLQIDELSNMVCHSCASDESNNLQECTRDSREKIFRIYATEINHIHEEAA